MKYYVREVNEYSGTVHHVQSFESLIHADTFVDMNSKNGILPENYWFMDVVTEENKDKYLGINQSDKRTRIL